jgi:DNA-binding transcriptional MerR regulator
MWTLDELVARVREALAAEYPGAPNGRVRDVPDRRAIRWYTTIGLVDRPLAMRGRTALYGPRHLEQLVAIKRRQAEGHSLATIQAEFTWLTPQGLSDAAQVPEHLLAANDPPPEHETITTRPRFWAESPAMGTPPHAPPPSAESGAEHGRAEFSTASTRAAAGAVAAGGSHGDGPAGPAPVHGVSLGGGAILLLPRPVPDHDRADLAAAAAPLLDLLLSRGLIDGRSS